MSNDSLEKLIIDCESFISELKTNSSSDKNSLLIAEKYLKTGFEWLKESLKDKSQLQDFKPQQELRDNEAAP